MPKDIFDELIADYNSKAKPISKDLIIAILKKHSNENLRINGLRVYQLIEKFNPPFNIPELEKIIEICEKGVATSLFFGEWELLKDFVKKLHSYLVDKMQKELDELPQIIPMSPMFEKLKTASLLQTVIGIQLIEALIDSVQNEYPVPYDVFHGLIKDSKDVLTIDECKKMLEISREASLKLKQYPEYIQIIALLEKLIKQLKNHETNMLWKN